MKPPDSKTKKKKKRRDLKRRKDLDPKLSCRICKESHLRYGSKMLLCADCLRPLPYSVKKYGTTDLSRILQGITKDMIASCGIEAAAVITGYDVATLDAIARGTVKLVIKIVGEDGPGAYREISQAMLERFTERGKEFVPLEEEAARLVAPWRPRAKLGLAGEGPGPRLQRMNRAKSRADLIRYVPRVSASMDPNDPENAYGRLAKVGRVRETIAMRPCLGMWGKGLGAPKIAEITQDTQWPTSRTSVSRMIKQAKYPFPGSVAVKISDLVLETWDRPIPEAFDDPADSDV